MSRAIPPCCAGLTLAVLVLGLSVTPARAQTVRVHVQKYLDGQSAAVTAPAFAFPMTAVWASSSHGSGSGPYTLSGPTYAADTVAFNIGANYSTFENTSALGDVRGTNDACAPGKYQLAGYSVGTSLAAAQAAGPSATVPAFTSLQVDQWVIVWNITCPTLVITKTTIGGDGTFNFSGNNGLGNFTIVTSGGTGRKAFYNVPANSYTVTETAQIGWTETANTCKPVVVPAAPASPVACGVTNTKSAAPTATVHIQKYLDGQPASVAAPAFAFPMTAEWTSTSHGFGTGGYTLAGPTYSADTVAFNQGAAYKTYENTSALGDVRGTNDVCAPGKYQLAGYSVGASLAAAQAAGPSSTVPDFTNLQADQWVIVWNITCPTLVITKTTVGGDGTFNFSGNNGLGNFTIVTSGGTGSKAFYNVPPNSYTVTETAQTGWTETVNTCTPIVVPAAPASAVTCGITNTQAPTSVTVHIRKYLDELPATTATANGFSFPMTAEWTSTSHGSSTSPYSLGSPTYAADTVAFNIGADYATFENTSAVGDVRGPNDPCAPGKYQLLGYRLSGTSFNHAETQPLLVAPKVIFANLQADKYVLVWNVRCPTLVVTKTAIGGDGTFNFSGNNGLGNFTIVTIGGTGSKKFYNVPGNSYTVTETAQAGWTETVNTCQPVVVPAAPLTTVTCGVTNTSATGTGKLKVIKNTVGGNGTFNFTGTGGLNFNVTTMNGSGSTTLDLAPGPYQITESLQSGWTQTGNGCSGPLQVLAGQTTTCTVTNKKDAVLGEIHGRKCADPNGNGNLNDCIPLQGWKIFLDTNGNGALDFWEEWDLTNAQGRYSFRNLPAGLYHVREVQKTGWIRTFPVSGKHIVDLSAGEIVRGRNFGNLYCGTP